MRIYFSIILLLLPMALQAQDTARFERKTFRTAEGSLPYRLLKPAGYKAGEQYPLVVFLHGSGERGTDNGKQLTWGAARFADSAQRALYPAWVIFPQCPESEKWVAYTVADTSQKGSRRNLAFPMAAQASLPLRLVSDLIDSMLASGQADPRRIYIGGLSLGAMGAYELLWRRPRTFAAAIAICGGGNEQAVKTYARGFPIWVFHGDRDEAVHVDYSRRMVAELKKHKARVRYTEYWGVDHLSWKNAFAEPDLFEWLFAQKRR